MAYLGKGKSILSCIQMEHYGAVINNKPTRLGGKKCILIDGYQIPLDINGGLPYLRYRKPTPDEVANNLPHLIMTADVDWDPCICDNNINDMEQFYCYNSVILILNLSGSCKPRCSAQSDNGDKGTFTR
jgi:hypothetical protein